MNSYNSPSTKPLYRGAQIVWHILTLVEILLLFRFFLKFFDANPTAGFTHFIYGITSFLVVPFVSVFRVTYVGGNIFEWTTLLAMLVYWIIAVCIVKLFIVGKTVSTSEAAEKLQ